MEYNDHKYQVRRSVNGRQWNIVDAKTGKLIEGGFFGRGNAIEIRDIREIEEANSQLK